VAVAFADRSVAFAVDFSGLPGGPGQSLSSGIGFLGNLCQLDEDAHRSEPYRRFGLDSGSLGGNMNENRRQILEMLSAGQISADEAERLIAAVEQPSTPANGSASSAKAKYLRIVVESEENGNGHGPVKVNVRVPMQLLRAGVKLAGLIPAQARDQVNAAMREHGMAFDLSQIKPENLEELIDQLNDLSVDVDVDDVDKAKSKVKVKVFCE
jgi:hypothetical protein